MFDRDTWREIFETMLKHKLRTGLTALGVFWGIFMLIFVMGMGTGLKNGVYQNFSKKSKNIMYVWANRTTKPYKGFRPGRQIRLKKDDIDAILDEIPEINYIAPRYSEGGYSIIYKEQSENYEVRGELWDMINIEALKIYGGRYINQNDVKEYRKVVVLGKRVRDELFGDEDCIGKFVRIKGISFKVVGVFGPMQIKPWTESDLEAVVIPLSTMERSFGTNGHVDYFVCSADDNISVSQIEPKVRELLKARHGVHPEDPRGIGGFNLEEEFKEIQGLFAGILGFLLFVGIGTMLAGIVGVSNIMLIVVKERTKEIGIRKALGASPRSIVAMILTESIFITSISGYIGLIVGTILIGGINYLMLTFNIENENFANPEVNLWVGVMSVVLLVVAGTLAGLIPALQASRVNPVVALKDE